jgi:MinD-like ATPase involved in chromosome partitioning or flagellar assembly
MKTLISQNLLGEARPDSFLFMFSPLMREDVSGITISTLVTKLTTDEFRVVVLDVDARARDIVRHSPAAGLFSAPFTANTVLGGLSGTGIGLLEPVMEEWAHVPFDPSDAAGVAALVQGGLNTADSTVSAAGGPFSVPLFSDAQPSAAWGEQPAQSAPASAVAPSWGDQPASSAAPAWGEQPAQVAPSWGEAPASSAAPAWGDQPAQVPPAAQSPQPSFGTQTPGWQEQAVPQPSGWSGGESWSAGQESSWPAQQWDTAPQNLQGGFAPAPGVQRRGFVMAVTVSKGGAGKSTLALNLGVWLGLRLRQAGKTVCVVDANFSQADIGKQLHRYSPNIVSLAKNPQDQDPSRISQHLLHMPNLHTSFLLGPTGVEDGNPLWITPELYAHSVEVLRQIFDYVIIDTPVAEFHNDIFDRFVLSHSDFLLVPVTPDVVTLQNTADWLQGICLSKHQGGKGFERDRVGIILNMATDGVGMDEADVQRNLASWNYLGAVPSSKVWQAARNEEEIVATRNYAEVNASFSRILGNATSDPDVIAAYVPVEASNTKQSRWPFKRRH